MTCISILELAHLRELNLEFAEAELNLSSKETERRIALMHHVEPNERSDLQHEGTRGQKYGCKVAYLQAEQDAIQW